MTMPGLGRHYVVFVIRDVLERVLVVASVVAYRQEILVELLDAEMAQRFVPEEIRLRRAEVEVRVRVVRQAREVSR